MTQYILVDNNDIARLVCEENIVVKDEDKNLDLVICTAEYYLNNVINGGVNR